MSAVTPAAQPAVSQQAVVEAALVLLQRMGLSPADLVAVPRDGAVVPTFAEYVPVVSAGVSAGTRRAYGSYWNRIVEHWGARRLDELAPSEIRQLMTWVKTHVVARRNARGGRSAQEHLVAALQCLYRLTKPQVRCRGFVHIPRCGVMPVSLAQGLPYRASSVPWGASRKMW